MEIDQIDWHDFILVDTIELDDGNETFDPNLAAETAMKASGLSLNNPDPSDPVESEIQEGMNIRKDYQRQTNQKMLSGS